MRTIAMELCTLCGMTTNPYAAAGSDVVSAGASSPALPTTEGRYCITCAYSLTGLQPNGQCPECATSIELSLREPTLANASREYIRTLRSGLSLVLNGILLQITCAIGAFLGGAVLGVMGGGGALSVLTFVLPGLMLLVSIMIMAGYWKYTAPDPSQVAFETTKSARSIIRIAVIGQIILSVISLAMTFIPVSARATAGGAAPAITPVMMLGWLLSLVSLALWAMQFFGVMRYTRWLATRVPDQLIVKQTKRYMWLLPLIGVLGAVLAGLGLLVALVMYWKLLDRLRTHLKSIERTGTPAMLKKMAGIG